MNRQLELARVVTGSTATNDLISREVESISEKDKNSMCQKLDAILKEHEMPIDQGWKCLKEDFSVVAAEYNIDTASLFAIYMVWLHSGVHFEKWDMK